METVICWVIIILTVDSKSATLGDESSIENLGLGHDPISFLVFADLGVNGFWWLVVIETEIIELVVFIEQLLIDFVKILSDDSLLVLSLLSLTVLL